MDTAASSRGCAGNVKNQTLVSKRIYGGHREERGFKPQVTRGTGDRLLILSNQSRDVTSQEQCYDAALEVAQQGNQKQDCRGQEPGHWD